MANEELAKVKVVLPKDAKNLYFGAQITVDGKLLSVFDFEIKSNCKRDDPSLILHLAPESFEIIVED